LRKKYPVSLEMWYWGRMEKIIWTDCVRNKEVVRGIEEEKNILHTVKVRKANWVGHVLCRNCLLKHVIEGKMAGGGMRVTGRRRRRCKQPLTDLTETSGYWKFKEEALGRTVWRIRFGNGYGSVSS
jgi:hypothetical protein